jgi:parallel beta-helix repeat protein
MRRIRLAAATVIAAAVAVTAMLALAVAGPVALTGAEAAGQGQPQCGDKITTDTTLHEDLVNCPNNGIRIGADNITLDLNGHLIDGDGTSEEGERGIGVENEHGNGVTVMHGSIRQFDGGVNLGNVRHNRMLDISAFNNTFVGIALFGSSRSVVRDSSGSSSTKRGEEIGVGLVGSHHVRVLHNSLRDNSETGIWVTRGSHNLVRANHIRGAGGDGVLVDERAKHTLLKGNRASGAKDDGFDVEKRTTKVTGNRALRNHDLGIEAVRGVNDGGGNVAHGNGDRRQCTHVACS